MWTFFDFFVILRDCYSALKAFIIIFIDGISCCFLVLSNQENLYSIHHDLELFFNIYNTINEHNRRQTNYLSLIPNCFDMYSYNLSASSFIMISMLSLFQCISRSSSLLIEEINLIAIVS